MSAIITGAIAAIILYFLYRYIAGNAGTVFEKDDPRLLTAKQQARDSLSAFWTALEADDPADEDFMLKFNLNHESGLEDNESIWAVDIQRRDGRIFGKLGNAPRNPKFRPGQEIEISPKAIDDWGYFRNGVAQGNYVTRLMLETAPAGIARKQRAAMGW